MATINYPALEAALAQAKLAASPAELHGSVTGYLCAGWGGRATELLAALALEPDDLPGAAALQAQVDGLAADIARTLRTGEGVEPLLPDGALSARANAMVDWCRGFLGGLGLTGVAPDAAHADEVRALLNDFGHIAAMHLECDDDDEQSLDDVQDFIRAGVVRLHAMLAPVARQ